MKKALSISLLFVLMAFGCKKSDQSPEDESKNNYQPVTKGSYWKYSNLTPSGSNLETVTMTGATKVINTRTYYEYESVLGSNQSGLSATGYFYAKDGIVMSALSDNSEVIFLKENAVVGETWIYSGPMSDKILGQVASEPYTIVAKLVEKGITHTVAGKAFTNVIHVKYIKNPNSGPTTDLYDYYIAKGVGMVERKTVDGGSNSLLVDYSIK